MTWGEPIRVRRTCGNRPEVSSAVLLLTGVTTLFSVRDDHRRPSLPNSVCNIERSFFAAPLVAASTLTSLFSTEIGFIPSGRTSIMHRMSSGPPYAPLTTCKCTSVLVTRSAKEPSSFKTICSAISLSRSSPWMLLSEFNWNFMSNCSPKGYFSWQAELT